MNLSPNSTCSSPQLTCPICGNPNLCALASNGDFATPCWCMKQKIDPAALAKIPDHLRNFSCICSGCAGIKTDNI